MSRTRSIWGWGVDEEALDDAAVIGLGTALAGRFEMSLDDPVPPPEVAELDLAASRLTPPDTLAALLSDAPYDRATHTYGKAFRDVVRALARDYTPAPDLVARPRTEADVIALLDWCGERGAVAIPFGGGSSVVGGVEARRADTGGRPVVSLDLGGLTGVVELDRTSRAARVLGGTYGPDLEDELRPEGLTLRHFPQSFEFSTVGGWLATRSGGHFATGPTHIDDFVESIRMVTPAGAMESRRLPGSGAGPSPDRLLLGSEGTLGIITEAWLRLQDRPQRRSSCAITFATFHEGADACRVLVQSGLRPANCRLLDQIEATTAGAGDGSASVLLLSFESAELDVGADMDRALTAIGDCSGTPGERRDTAGTGDRGAGAADSWRSAFLRAPYLRDAIARLGAVSETFETAVTWDRFAAFDAVVRDRAERAMRDLCGGGWVAGRLTHVYPDGAAPYYTVIAPAGVGRQLGVWDEMKAAVTGVIAAEGGTVTHHHAVGRDHRPGYDVQRPDLFAASLRSVKRTLDPNGTMNPGVLIDPG